MIKATLIEHQEMMFPITQETGCCMDHFNIQLFELTREFKLIELTKAVHREVSDDIITMVVVTTFNRIAINKVIITSEFSSLIGYGLTFGLIVSITCQLPRPDKKDDFLRWRKCLELVELSDAASDIAL